jgi:hypothetical protein
MEISFSRISSWRRRNDIAIGAIIFLVFQMSILPSHAQTYNQMDVDGNITQRDELNRNFNPHNNDTTSKNKEVPKGIYVWTVDRKFGDIHPAVVDTMPHLYPQSTFATGRYMQYNTIGSNYTARQNRIFNDRPVEREFLFTDVYDQALRTPDQWHFTNTLSPITNLSYGTCGDKQNGEDLFDAKFAANVNKRLGFGFDLNYLYARGYYQNQNVSHFNATVYTSYLGDQYQLHALFSNYHQKSSENGGIASDEYILHPEAQSQNFAENEIPVILDQNWNRNDQQHFFLTHRYCVGFYRKVKMTDEEIAARKFAEASKKEKEARKADKDGKKKKEKTENAKEPEFTGRPDDAVVLGDAPAIVKSDTVGRDTTRIAVQSKAEADSLLALQAKADSIEATFKREFVPVTSFIHTFELSNNEHIYQAYRSPKDYYADTFFDWYDNGYSNDSIYDQTRLLDIRNTFALALLEGFNKYVPAGLKAFITHQLRKYDMPEIDSSGVAYLGRWNEHNVSIGGQLQRTQGHTLHYNVTAETWLIGEDAGQLKLTGQTDLNFPLFGDTVRLAARAHFYRLNPSFIERRYHSKHLWWDNDLSKETRTRIEGAFTYEKTKTTLRVAVEEIQNYTYLTMSNTYGDAKKTGLTAAVAQYGSNLNVMTAQLEQRFALGPLNWENILTYQSSANQDVLPLPKLNVFSNLYLKFMVARVLLVELGGCATWFSKYYVPDFCPQLSSYAIQQNESSRVELGNFPFIDVYANLHLKHARFFVMMANAAGTSFNRKSFLAPHYPMNNGVLHFGISWNFFN